MRTPLTRDSAAASAEAPRLPSTSEVGSPASAICPKCRRE